MSTTQEMLDAAYEQGPDNYAQWFEDYLLKIIQTMSDVNAIDTEQS